MNNLILSIEDFKLVEQSLESLSFEINIDDVFINNNSYTVAVKIVGFKINKNEYNKDKESNNDVDINDYIIVLYKETQDYELNIWEEKQSTNSLKNFVCNFKDATVLKSSQISDYKEKAKKFISGEITEQDLIDSDDNDADKDESNYLISKSSKTTLISIQKDLEDKKKNAQIIHNFVTFEMKKKKAELEAIRERLNGVLSVFKKKISKIMRVITTIELYLGIDEEIFQIQSGELAPKDTPISFRQALLYMDEETGNWNNGGLDWTDINWFDEWLIKDNNYKNVLPEEKGLVVFRPRRYKKEYYDRYHNSVMNQKNMSMTYLLIRNGDNLYRVYTENISIQPRLFPLYAFEKFK
jgi:hypothetical protein